MILDYHCTRCEVRGLGDRCWMCGSTTALRPTVIRDPGWFDNMRPARRGRAPAHPAPVRSAAGPPRPVRTRKARVHDALASEVR